MLKYLSLYFVVILAISLVLDSQLVAQSSFEGALPRSDNSDLMQKRARVRPAPNIDIRSPLDKGFFQGGKKFFPPSFQASVTTGTPDMSSSAQADEDYRVGPGDQFLINFWGKVEDNLVVSINSSNQLFLPRIGVIDATEMTYKDLVQAINKKIDASMKDVQFIISLYRPREFTVYVLGSVKKAGALTVQATMRASDVLEKAGGPLSTGSKQYIEIRRSNGKVDRLDLIAFNSFGDFSKNPFLTENDVIFVPVLSEFVTVMGAVVQPGTFEIRETKKLQDVIQKLGGFSVYADHTAPIKISRRASTGERYNVYVRWGKDKDQTSLHPKSVSIDELVLQNGDEVFVSSAQVLIPSRSNAVFVTGEVKNPGTKPYEISMSVDEYIGSAGGLTSRADFSGAVVYKTDGSTVRVSPRMAIEPGDTIYIPEKTFKFWQDHVAILTTFLSLATSIIVLSGR